MTLAAISRRCDGWWTPDELLNVERGLIPLDDASVVSFCRLYGLPGSGLGEPESLELVLDRSESAELMPTDPGEGAGPRSHAVSVIARLCALARLVGADVATLAISPAVAEALDLDTPTVAELTRELLEGSDRVRAVAEVLDERVAVPSVGLSVGETRHGLLLMVRKAGGPVRTSPEPVPAAGPLRWFTALAAPL